MSDATERFSDRVENYIKYRPGYPEALFDSLVQQCGLKHDSIVADVGSGTGILTTDLLKRDLTVYAVEPNRPMRLAAEQLLAEFPRFSSLDSSAENIALGDQTVDLITAAQSFHWFNNNATRAEFSRLLRPAGKLALIWNQRKIYEPFQQGYDAILRELAPEYGKVNHMNIDDNEIATWFVTGKMETFEFDNFQLLDFDSLLGRLQSASYCPAEGSPEYASLSTALSDLFDKHALDDRIRFEYDTRLFLGAIAE